MYTNGLKNLLKSHSFSFQNHVFPQQKSRQKASSTLPESIFPELFFQVKKLRKNNEKHNALIRLLRKNHVKTLFFLIKTTYFHAKKHQNLAKKTIPAHANGQACDRTFS